MATEMSPLTRRLAEAATPLTAKEERRAVRAAVAHLGGDGSVYGAELRIDKPARRGGAPRRRIAVLVGEIATGVVSEILVEADGTVVGAKRNEGVVVPFTAAEIDRAAAVAEADSVVARLARRKGVMRAPFYPSAHSHGGRKPEGGRRIGFHYLSAANPRRVKPLISVVVDLGTAQVESTLAHEPGGSDRGR